MEPFLLSRDKTFHRNSIDIYGNSNGDIKSIVFSAKKASGNGFGIFFNGDAVVMEFPNRDVILGYYSQRGLFLAKFSSGRGSDRVCDTNFSFH